MTKSKPIKATVKRKTIEEELLAMKWRGGINKYKQALEAPVWKCVNRVWGMHPPNDAEKKRNSVRFIASCFEIRSMQSTCSMWELGLVPRTLLQSNPNIFAKVVRHVMKGMPRFKIAIMNVRFRFKKPTDKLFRLVASYTGNHNDRVDTWIIEKAKSKYN